MITKRRFVAGAGALAAAAAIPAEVRGQQNLRVRRNIASLAPDDPVLQTYRRAVTQMMALPLSDRRNWFRQARIHNDSCAHNNWFFPPWHREYLLRFEQIVRVLGGDPNFNLPFWDWNTNRQLPASFWGANNSLNPANLNFQPFAQADATFAPAFTALGNARAITTNGVVGDDVNFSLMRLRTRVFQAPTFVALASAEASSLTDGGPQSYLENRLHGRVHGNIGGQMGAFFSPLDPIFWLHHANVDRLWALWQRGNPTIAPPASWRNLPLPAGMFADGNGNDAPQITCGALENNAGLGYTYETVPNQEQLLLIAALNLANQMNVALSSTGPATPPQTATFAGEAPPSNRTSEQTFVAIDVPVPPQQLPDQQTLIARETGLSPIAEPVLAYLTLADLPRFPDAQYRVFINCDYLNPSTPRADPSYVSTVSLFGTTHHAGGSAVLKVALSDAVAALDRSQRGRRQRLTIQVQPEPLSSQKEVTSSIAFTKATVEVTKA